LEVAFTANLMTDTDKQNSTGNTQTKHNSEKANNAKYSKTNPGKTTFSKNT